MLSKIQIHHFQNMLFKYPPPYLRATKSVEGGGYLNRIGRYKEI